jgi:hypothetical protein
MSYHAGITPSTVIGGTLMLTVVRQAGVVLDLRVVFQATDASSLAGSRFLCAMKAMPAPVVGACSLILSRMGWAGVLAAPALVAGSQPRCTASTPSDRAATSGHAATEPFGFTALTPVEAA